ncbi:MAG: nucleotidyltransferase domain-containing protein [Clostridium sp.]|nr:nucleotidyltransferase domain-containing protein [Clostridium sp.]
MELQTTQSITDRLLHYLRENGARHGIQEMALFGSVARGEQTADSDIDVCVRLKKKSFFERMAIKEELERLFQKSVDVISMDAMMQPEFKKNLLNDAIFI